MFTRCLTVASILAFTVALRAAETVSTNDYSAVEATFTKHCLDCHAAQDPEGKLVLESFETLMKGGENGAVIVPGKNGESRLVRMIEGQLENKDGKKLIMPPGKRKKLEAAEIATIKAWIDGGAKPPAEGKPGLIQLVTPKITPKVPPRRAIKALAYAPGPKLIAAARYGEVELRSADKHTVVRTLSGHRGSVNALVFSSDGNELFAAAGEPALFGEVRQWNVSDGMLVRTFEGHRDALYSVALSPDGKILATGSYDQKIKLWNTATGEELKTLSGHNGAVFDLAFRPDGKILASASGDRTVKLWEVATGGRRDTLSQSLKELYSLVFSPDGQRLVAGGVDNRIRVWQISEKADETTNPILYSKFAHEGAILKIVYSSDGKTLLSSAEDRTVKLWDAAEVVERFVLEAQSDWAPALAFASENKTVVVGRLDGTLGFYDASTARPLPPPKPEVSRIEPRGIQRGVAARIRLIGSNLTSLNEVKFDNSKLTGELVLDPKSDEKEAWINVTASPDLARGSYEFSVRNPSGESGKLKLHVDDLPQVYGSESSTNRVAALPVSFWGTINKPGGVDQFNFEASAGQMIVFDLAGKSIGSKVNGVITLADSTGTVLAVDNGFDGGDPLLEYRLPASGRYTVRINDLLLAASEDHFFRVSVGQFPYVTGFYPLSVAAKSKSEIELIGYNLPVPARVAVSAEKPGELDLPLKADEFRSRRALKVLVSDTTELVESEPNDQPKQATPITAPCAVSGRLWAKPGGQSGDVDIFQFDAKAGQTWIIETQGAQRGSPIDTKIEILYPDGRPVERLLLQAVRDSHVTFRGIDSNSTDCRVENWEEMELNQYLYLQGEVVKLFRAPQGPDSGFVFYSSNGKRRGYFDTSATTHANDEPCYIVEAHPLGAKLVASGLPIFTLYYANDDDGERKLGTDSKLHFTAPADSAYLIRVSDSRGASGERFTYRLVVREPKPDFMVTVNGANPEVNIGSGKAFSVSAERSDGLDGEITLDITGLPPGFFVSTPLVIQAGHTSAAGTINAALDAPQPNETNSAMSKVTATALVNGKALIREVNNFGKIKLGDKPKLSVALEPDSAAPSSSPTSANPDKPLEITIAPGQTIPAWLRIKRNGHDDLVTFTVENLPHGVIVDNIGLNGVLIPKEQNERQIFLNAAKWVPETDRLCYAIENQAGRQTSLPVLLHVRKPVPTRAAITK